MESPLLKVKQAAELMNVNIRTIYKLRDAGVLDWVPIGAHNGRITRESIERHIKTSVAA